MSRHFYPVTFTVVASILVALVMSEVILRGLGFRPWQYHVFSNEPTLHASDAVLGWRNKQGDYTFPPYDPSGNPIHITFLENGKRRTGNISTGNKSEIVIVGGSYTQGWAISDNETFPWKIQEKYPALNILNYGTGGYGTYQSLLVLEKELPRMTSPKSVLYGFISHHESRNVAPTSWLHALSSASRRGHVNVPFVTLDETNNIIRHPPEGYLSLPFRESLATIAQIEHAYMKLKTRNRYEQKTPVTKALLLEMDRLSRKHGSSFHVVFLRIDEDEKSQYINFMEENNIKYIDCAYPITEDMKVPGEGHPNGTLNSLWSECILDSVDLGSV